MTEWRNEAYNLKPQYMSPARLRYSLVWLVVNNIINYNIISNPNFINLKWSKFLVIKLITLLLPTSPISFSTLSGVQHITFQRLFPHSLYPGLSITPPPPAPYPSPKLAMYPPAPYPLPMLAMYLPSSLSLTLLAMYLPSSLSLTHGGHVSPQPPIPYPWWPCAPPPSSLSLTHGGHVSPQLPIPLSLTHGGHVPPPPSSLSLTHGGHVSPQLPINSWCMKCEWFTCIWSDKIRNIKLDMVYKHCKSSVMITTV